MCVCVHACLHVGACVYMHMCVNVCVHAFVHMYVHVCVCVYSLVKYHLNCLSPFLFSVRTESQALSTIPLRYIPSMFLRQGLTL